MLQSSHIGQRINQFYNKNGYLENSQRNEIVRLIVSDVMRQGESLSPKDLRAILGDIITLFPNEQAAAVSTHICALMSANVWMLLKITLYPLEYSEPLFYLGAIAGLLLYLSRRQRQPAGSTLSALLQ